MLSVALHSPLLAGIWWLHQRPSAPQYVAVEEPIEWISSESSAGGGGGGGGGGAGDGKTGGGGGGGSGTAVQADKSAPDADMPPATDSQKTSAQTDTDADGTFARAQTQGKKSTSATKAAQPAKKASAPNVDALIAARKRELAKLQDKRIDPGQAKAGIGSGEGGGVGEGKGAGIGAGSGKGIGSGAGTGIGSHSGAGTGGGTGAGLGSGTGAGVGSGTGGGTGSGSGTGTGSGRGTGAGSGEGSGIGSGVGSGVGSGYGEGAGKDKANWQSVLQAYLSSRKRYPSTARRLRQEGTVAVQASFSANGELLSASVVKSAESDILDEAALQLVREAANAAASKAQPGQAVSRRIPVVYKLMD